ncbi:MAG: endo-1,4-beta-xylanase [Acidobacteriia bacterium]|nr:endo-1,4-beta-xylanase [Terriglobia bacterium]
MSSRFVTLCGLLIAGLAGGAGAQPQAPAAALKDAFKDSFRIGAALNQAQFEEKDERGARIVTAQFNTISPENVLKWESVHPRPGAYRFDAADRYVAFGEKNKMFIVGHCLVWHNQTPRWVFQNEQGEPLGREALLERLRDHIRTVVGRYRGRIAGWDVVNEALADDGSLRPTPWLKIIGEEYIAKAFEFARDADPRAELYYNDFALENEAKRKGAVELIRKLQARGIPIAAVGLQGHDRMDWPTIAQQSATIEAFSALGVKVNVTELDIDVLPPTINPYASGLPDNVQTALAKRYGDLFGVFAKYRDVITRVTFWGVTDGDSWLNDWPVQGRTSYPLLFDRHGQPKPAFQAVIRSAAVPKALYNETKVPQYTLPDPLIMRDGRRVADAGMWTGERRPEIVKLFEDAIYGHRPVERPKAMTWKVLAEDRHAAITKSVRLFFSGKEDGPGMDLTITLPNTGEPVPVFLLAGGFGAVNPMVLDRGYGMVAASIVQIQSDNKNDAWKGSIREYFAKPGQTAPGPDDWGALSVWAWGLSRAMDYLETDPDVDTRRVMLNGVSRFGKAAMWAGALDTRFAATFSGEAGCAGQVILRRGFGETVKAITSYAPHWFNGRFIDYAGDVTKLPVDYHEMVALYAPRPVYIAAAQQDSWGDPRGSFLSGVGAEPVYNLFQEAGLGTTEWPPVDTPVGNFVGYHVRSGSHGQNNYDWEQFMNFADRHFAAPVKPPVSQ